MHEGETLRIYKLIEEKDRSLEKLKEIRIKKLKELEGKWPIASNDPQVFFKLGLNIIDDEKYIMLIRGIIERRLENNPDSAIPWITELLVTAAKDSMSSMWGKEREKFKYIDELATDNKWNVVLASIANKIADQIKQKSEREPQVINLLRPAWKKLLGLTKENIPTVATDPVPETSAEAIVKSLVSNIEFFNKIAECVVNNFFTKILQEASALNELQNTNNYISTINLKDKWNRKFLEELKKKYSQSIIISTVAPALEKIMELNEKLEQELKEKENDWQKQVAELENEINVLRRKNEEVEGQLQQVKSELERFRKDNKALIKQNEAHEKEKTDLMSVIEKNNKEIEKLGLSKKVLENELEKFKTRRPEKDVLKDILEECREEMVNLLECVPHWRKKDEYGLRVADTIIDFFEELRKAGIEYIGIPGDEVPFDRDRHTLDVSSETIADGQTVVIETPGWSIKGKIKHRAEVKVKNAKGEDAGDQANS
jgi:hypothetical protein